MEGNRSRKRSNSQFNRNGGNKKGKRQNSSRGQDMGNVDSADTVYRILCPDRKMGGVIGKGGGRIKALREETQAKITVADSVPGSDERVIVIHSPASKVPQRENSNGESGSENNEKDDMEPNCPAQDALLKVHDRIIEDDLFGGVKFEDDNENNAVTVRLLVPSNMVGCLIGKGGDVITKLRSETSANIRVLPKEHLPSCAMDTDELVQISGAPPIVKKALYVVSTKLHQNPRKDKQPKSFPMPTRGRDFPPPGGPMWPHQNPNSHGMPPMGREEYRNRRSGDFDGGEGAGEFSMKILCTEAKIGGVIGKAGSVVRQLEQETGASIHVEAASKEKEERSILVSAFEELRNPRSQTIDAMLELQSKTSEYSDKGKITTRLLVPSTKIGCILGEGGHVINEMRRRTRADIRIFPKNDKPRCAAEDEELVQISAIYQIARDVLGEIGSRLRARTLRDSNGREVPPPVGLGPVHGFGHGGNFPRRGPPPPPPYDAYGAANSDRYNIFEGARHEYEHPSYPRPPPATRYPTVYNHHMETNSKYPNEAVGSVQLHDSQTLGGSECVVEIRGSSQHLNAAHGIVQSYNFNSQNSPYRNNNAQHGSSYQSVIPPPPQHQGMIAPQQGSSYYQGGTTDIQYQSSYAPPPQGSYPNQGTISQQSSYQSAVDHPQQGTATYPNPSLPLPQSSYQY